MKQVWDAVMGWLGWLFKTIWEWFTALLASWNWGTVPDWLAAIGTVGALFWALWLFKTERDRRTSREADEFAVWYASHHMHAPDGSHLAIVTVSVHNSGNQPILYRLLRVRDRFKLTEYTNYDPVPIQYFEAPLVSPGQTLHFTLEPKPHDFIPVVYVEFADSSGRHWVRNVTSGRYLKKKQVEELHKVAGTSVFVFPPEEKPAPKSLLLLPPVYK